MNIIAYIKVPIANTLKIKDEKFIANGGNVKIKGESIAVEMKKKRELPLLLETMTRYKESKYE